MRYYTKFELTVRNIESLRQFEELTEILEDRELLLYAFNPGVYYLDDKEASFATYDEVEWKDYPAEMVMISEKFPRMYFELEGCGQDVGDFWKAYFHDGECEMCRGEIVYEQPKKMQWDKLLSF